MPVTHGVLATPSRDVRSRMPNVHLPHAQKKETARAANAANPGVELRCCMPLDQSNWFEIEGGCTGENWIVVSIRKLLWFVRRSAWKILKRY